MITWLKTAKGDTKNRYVLKSLYHFQLDSGRQSDRTFLFDPLNDLINTEEISTVRQDFVSVRKMNFFYQNINNFCESEKVRFYLLILQPVKKMLV